MNVFGRYWACHLVVRCIPTMIKHCGKWPILYFRKIVINSRIVIIRQHFWIQFTCNSVMLRRNSVTSACIIIPFQVMSAFCCHTKGMLHSKVTNDSYISMATCPTCLTNILKIFQESDLKICATLVSGTYAMCAFALLVK